MTETTTADLQSFPIRRGCPFDPPQEYDRLRAEQPVSRVRLPGGDTAWLVTRYPDVRTVLTDPAFSSDATRPGFPLVRPEMRPMLRQRRPFTRMDPPEHDFYRRMLIQDFTVKRVRALRAGIQSTVNALIDNLLARTRPVDLVDALALPVPSLVICQLLGVPYADHEFFQARTRILLSSTSTQEQSMAAVGQLLAYLNDLIAQKQRSPADDLLSKLVTGYLEPAGELRREDLVTTCMLLLNAGHETTSNMISLGTVALLEHPDQLAALRADPETAPGAVEELLRYLSIADFVPARVAVEDIEIAGTKIRAGEGVIALLGGANRDPGTFADPGRLDLGRGARHHVAFGYGVHQCLGHNLARLELEVVFSTLFARIPTLRLAAPLDELPYKHDSVLFGLYELPVTW
jgi:cytochrome P450